MTVTLRHSQLLSMTPTTNSTTRNQCHTLIVHLAKDVGADTKHNTTPPQPQPNPDHITISSTLSPVHSTVEALHNQTMSADILLGLRYAARIQMQYTITHEEGNSEQVWWPASIKKLNLIDDVRGPTLTAVIQFQPHFGFKSSSMQVHIISQDTLRDSKNKNYPWRLFQDSTNSSPSSAHTSSPHSADDPADIEFVPEQASSVRKRKAPEDKETVVENHTDPQLTQLARQIGTLQTDVISLIRDNKEMRAELNHLHSKKPQGTYHVASQLSNPLAYLALRIRPFLEKVPAPPTRANGSELRGGFAIYSQEIATRTADCTLLQFDRIAHLIHDRIGERAIFHPNRDILKSIPPTQAHIIFQDFHSMASIFGTISDDVLQSTMVRHKTEKPSGRVTALRLLGELVFSEHEANLPMYITVGKSIPYAVQRGLSSVNVIRRNNTSWNSLDNQFISPLQQVTIPASVLDTHPNTQTGSAAIPIKKTFSISWKTESHPTPNRILTPPPTAGDIMGSLQLTIPYINVRRSDLCNELYNAIIHPH